MIIKPVRKQDPKIIDLYIHKGRWFAQFSNRSVHASLPFPSSTSGIVVEKELARINPSHTIFVTGG